jgi:drug/metabolite transporter, DME family
MEVPPTSLAILRPAVGAIFLLLVIALVERGRAVPPTRVLAWMLLGGGVIVGVFQLAYQMSTEALGVPATVALLYLAPAFVVAASAVLFGERATLAKGILATLSVIGVWLTVLGARGVDVELTLRGVSWGVLCGVGYASYTLFGKHFSKSYGALAPLTWSTVGGTFLLALVWGLRGEPVTLPGTPEAWVILLLFGVLTIAASALLLFNALRTLEAGRAAIGTTIEPLVATLLAVFLLDQTLTGIGVTGLVLLVCGVIGAYALPSRRSAEAGALTGPAGGSPSPRRHRPRDS